MMRQRSRSVRSIAAAFLVSVAVASLAVAFPGPASGLADPKTTRVAFVDDVPESRPLVAWIDAGAALGQVRVAFLARNLLADPSMRVEVYSGDPSAAARRTVVTLRDGALAGVMQSGSGGSWRDEGPAIVARVDEGVLDIERPVGGNDSDQLWVAVSHDRDGAKESAVTPLFAVADLDLKGPPVSQSSSWAWLAGADGQLVPVAAPPGPSFSIDESRALWTFNATTPTDIGGRKVSKVEDIVRIRLDGVRADSAVRELHIDESQNLVRLTDAVTGEGIDIPDSPNVGAPPGAGATTPARGAGEPFQFKANVPVGPNKRFALPLLLLESALGGPLTPATSMVASSRRITFADGGVAFFGGVAKPVGESIEGGESTGAAGAPTTVAGPAADDAEAEEATQRSEALRVLFIAVPLAVLMVMVQYVIRRHREARELGGAPRSMLHEVDVHHDGRPAATATAAATGTALLAEPRRSERLPVGPRPRVPALRLPGPAREGTVTGWVDTVASIRSPMGVRKPMNWDESLAP